MPAPAAGRVSPAGGGTARRSPGPGRWGALQGGLGVCIIVASAALGTIATMVTRSAPGFLLGLFVVAGTVIAALAVRPRAGRMIFPVPVLSYLVGALISGFIYNRSTGTSKTALAIGAAQWIANGFFAMALATVLAIVIITARWYLWRRRREVSREPDWPAPAATRPVPPRGPRPAGGSAMRRRSPPGGQRDWNDADRAAVPGGRGRGREPGPTTSPAGRSGAPGA